MNQNELKKSKRLKTLILKLMNNTGGINMKGKVKFFNSSKGFGFIAGEDGKEYFAHLTGLTPGTTLKENDAVNFEIEQGDKGPKAVKVSKA